MASTNPSSISTRLSATRLVTAGVCVAVAILLLAALWLWRPWAGGDATERWQALAGERDLGQLNVVLVTIDTLRADRLAAYGYDDIETPAVDALAREGVLFANAATTVPFTLPAHSSIMTGTYPPYHGVRENVGYALDPEVPTLAAALAAQGYDTGGFVSAFVLDSRWGIDRGFERYFDDFDLAEMETANLASVQRPGNETVEEAIGWLDERDGRAPFFLWLHLFEPHDPYTPPGPYLERYPGRPYDGEVAYADYLVGEFRKALERRGLWEDTLVVLTGDHGEGLGDHGESYHGYFVYDSTVRVPLIVRAPFGELGGRVVEEAASHVDLLPTVLAATGRDATTLVGPHLQGESLLPRMLDPGAGGDEPGGPEARAVYTESYYPLFHYGWAPLRALRSSRYKFIEAPQAELYDLVDDPAERRNLLTVNPRRPDRDDWQSKLAALTEGLEFEGERGGAEVEMDEETLQQLRALGYVAGRGAIEENENESESESTLPRADPKDKIELHQLVMLAQGDVGSGDEAAAEEKLRRALEQDPGLLDAHQILGTIENRRGNHQAAVARFRDALELDPEHRTALLGLATAYEEMGRTEDALVGYRRLLELDPSNTQAVLAIARIQVDRGDRGEALRLLQEATAQDDAPAILHNQLGELLALEGRQQEAVERFRRAIEANDDLAQPHFNLAVIYEERRQASEAIEHYRAAIERAPKHYQAQFNLGRLYGALGRLEAQREMYEAAVESNPDFARGRFFLAKLLMDRGLDLERAEELTRDGLERLEVDSGNRDPETAAFGWFLLADILNRRGRPAEARTALQRARLLQARGTTSR